MSGYPTPETVADVVRLGAVQFIPKPFKPDEFMKSIREVIRKMPHKTAFPTGAG
jgi:DNA-binding NtrC family response regulator